MVVHPVNRKRGFTRIELYKLLDVETINIVELPDGRRMVLDYAACALERSLPVNLEATLIWWQMFGIPNYPIAGDVLVGTTSEIV